MNKQSVYENRFSANGSRWENIHDVGVACPICGKPDWCSITTDRRWAICHRVQRPDARVKSNENGAYYLYNLQGLSDFGECPEYLPPAAETIPRADPDTLNSVYGTILENLTLGSTHRQSLEKRGLSEQEILSRGYKSCPAEGVRSVVRSLQEKFNVSVLQSVPGFYLREYASRSGQTHRRLSLSGCKGIVIPVRDFQGRIAALKIRLDTPTSKGKFISVSSRKHGGPKSLYAIHWPVLPEGIHPESLDSIIVTEGELKADIITARGGGYCISIPGVNAWPKVFLDLEKFPTIRTVSIAFDMDARTNPAVALNLKNFAKALQAKGYQVQVLTWDDRGGQTKGLDDLLAAGLQPEIITGDNVMVHVEAVHRQSLENNPPPHMQVITKARAILKDMMERCHTDPGVAFEETSLESMAMIREARDHAELARLKKGLKGIVVWRDLEQAVREWEDQRARMAPATAGTDPSSAIEAPLNTVGNPYAPDYAKALTDIGNAERFALQNRDKVRYCHDTGEMYAWVNSHWKRDRQGISMQLAKKTVVSIYAEAAQVTGTDSHSQEKRDQIIAHARRSQNEARIRAMINLAQTEPGISCRLEEFDKDPFLLTVSNGTYNLKEGCFQPHNPSDLNSKQAPVIYDPLATCPTWEGFLNKVLDGDKDLIAYLQRAAGYALTGDITERCFFVLYGSGRNGKSTFVETIRTILGDYADNIDAEKLFDTNNHDKASNEIARMRGTRFIAIAECSERARIPESRIKALTGNEAISARKLYQESFSFTPTFKIFLSTNHLPQAKGADAGLYDRYRIIPFVVRIQDHEVDLNLQKKLLLESSGILNWAIQGCVAWQRDGLGIPAKIKNAVADYREESDVLGHFFMDKCILKAGIKTSSKDLHAAYSTWCSETGEHGVSQRILSKLLKERGIRQTGRSTGGRRFWLGIGLLSEDESTGVTQVSDEDPFSPNFSNDFSHTCNFMQNDSQKVIGSLEEPDNEELFENEINTVTHSDPLNGQSPHNTPLKVSPQEKASLSVTGHEKTRGVRI